MKTNDVVHVRTLTLLILVSGICTLTALFLLGCTEGADQADSSESSPKGAEMSRQEQLATLDAHGPVSEDDLTVKRFRFLLERLDGKFVEDRQEIADLTVRARELLEEVGIGESLLNIMEGVNTVFTEKVENQKYLEYVSAYVTLRKEGMSHEDATAGLKGMIDAITSK